MKQFLKPILIYMQDQYATVLIFIAAVSSLTFLLLGNQLQDQEGGSAEVQRSSGQIALIREIGSLALQLERSTDNKGRVQLRTQLLKNLNFFRETHDYLSAGRKIVMEKGHMRYVSGVLSPQLRSIYFGSIALDQQAQQYMRATKAALRLHQGEYKANRNKIQYLYSTPADKLIDALEAAVSVYQKQNEQRLSTTLLTLNFMFALTMVSLIIMGLLLLKPLVSKLKDSMSGLQTEKDFSDNVINTAQALIIGLDPDGNITLFNQFAENATGWFEHEVKGNHFIEQFIHEDQRNALDDLFDLVMSGNTAPEDEIETQVLIRTEEYLQVIWQTTVITDPHTGMPTMFLITGVDITERERAQQQLQSAMNELEQISTRLQEEVNFAARVQRAILPSPTLELPGLQGEATLITSSEVGGDYYDYFEIGSHHSVLMVGDVSGHGVAAGTMVSAAKAAVYPLIQEGIISPSEILHSLNETMLATAHQSLLMTMACVSLDARDGKLSFANAGHVLPYLRRKEEQHWTMLEASGLPLGKSVDADYLSDATEIQLEVGDRIILFTDALIEEESSSGEAFGYDRLEQILNQYANAKSEVLRELLLTALRHHCGTDAFTDDVTIMVVDHSDRVTQAVTQITETSDIIRLAESFYRHGEHPIPRISKQYVVFLADGEFADLFPRFNQDGICRVLPRNNAFYKQLGWNRFLTQHHETPDDDLYALLTDVSPEYRQYELTHSDDKDFILQEIVAWLEEQNLSAPDHIDSLVVLLDEMIENSLYAAPRDGQDKPYFKKGESRELGENEEIKIDVAVANGALGLMITDNWGTLTQSTFLNRMTQTMEQGIEAGMGGGGLYMMWRMSDYLQIRVHPHKLTQVTLLWDLSKDMDMGLNSGFQFLIQSEFDAVKQLRA